MRFGVQFRVVIVLDDAVIGAVVIVQWRQAVQVIVALQGAVEVRVIGVVVVRFRMH